MKRDFELYFVKRGSYYGMTIFLKAKIPFNLEKASEIATLNKSWRASEPNIPFRVNSSNVTDITRFMKTSKAESALTINHSFDVKQMTPENMSRWFGRTRQERFILVNSDFGLTWRERRDLFDRAWKTKNFSEIENLINKKGLDIENLSISGPKWKPKGDNGKDYITYSINLDLEEAVGKGKRNGFFAKEFAKFLTNGSYKFKFLDYDV